MAEVQVRSSPALNLGAKCELLKEHSRERNDALVIQSSLELSDLSPIK